MSLPPFQTHGAGNLRFQPSERSAPGKGATAYPLDALNRQSGFVWCVMLTLIEIHCKGLGKKLRKMFAPGQRGL
jgi:hypothetical protein